MSEGELVQRARGGDFDAFAALVTGSEAKVYAHLLRLTGNAEDARDLLQETYLSAYRHLGSFKGDSAFGTWAYRIATNLALMRLRKKKPDTVNLDEVRLPTHQEIQSRSISEWAIDPKEAVLRKEVRLQLDRAIRSLPPLYRAVVALRDIEGLSTAETAEALDISEGAVKTRLHRARIFLREALSPYFEGDAAAAAQERG